LRFGDLGKSTERHRAQGSKLKGEKNYEFRDSGIEGKGTRTILIFKFLILN